MKNYRIRKGDRVMVITGDDKGKVGNVLKVLTKKDSVIVEKVKMVTRHTKPNPYRQQPGGKVEKEMPIHITNVMLMCDTCAAPVRVGYREEEGKKVRFCKKCNKNIG